MVDYQFYYNGHRFDIDFSFLGNEKVMYDGKLVSEKSNPTNDLSRHEFEVLENENNIHYAIILKNYGDEIDVFRNEEIGLFKDAFFK